MRRAINELSSDETNRGTGVKVGDYGTGSRTYKRYARREHEVGGGTGGRVSDGPWWPRVMVWLSCILAVCAHIYFENAFQLTIGTFEEASQAYSYGSTPFVDTYKEGEIVHATSEAGYPPTLLESPPIDGSFGLYPPDNVALLHRQTEYCQWQEFEHRNRKKVGQEPDYCSSSGDSSESSCEGVRCDGLSNNACTNRQNCCRWRRGADIIEIEITYTYQKQWRSYRINSLLFDSAAAYHNPQRDPFPSKDTWTLGDVDVAGGRTGGLISGYGAKGLKVQPQDLYTILGESQTIFLDREAAYSSYDALREGFTEVTHEHFLSRVPEDGWNDPVLKAGASYLVDGVIDANAIAKATGIESLLGRAGLDWITKGTCNAGDIRVKFLSQALPSDLTVIGQQTKHGRIAAKTYENGLHLMMVSGKEEGVAGILSTVKTAAEWNAIYRRVGVFGVLLIFLCICSPSIIDGASLAVLLTSTSVSMLWVYFFGVNNAYTIGGLLLALLMAGFKYSHYLPTFTSHNRQAERTKIL